MNCENCENCDNEFPIIFTLKQHKQEEHWDLERANNFRSLWQLWQQFCNYIHVNATHWQEEHWGNVGDFFEMWKCDNKLVSPTVENG